MLDRAIRGFRGRACLAIVFVAGLSAGITSCKVDTEKLCQPGYCDDAGGGLPYICKPLTGVTKVQCLTSEIDAVSWCQGLGGTARLPNCYYAEAETGTDTGSEAPAWEPGAYVSYDELSGEHHVHRLLVEQLKADWSLLMNDTARVSATEFGYYVLEDIAPRDLAALMSLQSGDVLLEVNGYDLGTLDGQMRAYTELEDEVVFTLTFERRGELMRHTYLVVDSSG